MITYTQTHTHRHTHRQTVRHAWDIAKENYQLHKVARGGRKAGGLPQLGTGAKCNFSTTDKHFNQNFGIHNESSCQQFLKISPKYLYCFTNYSFENALLCILKLHPRNGQQDGTGSPGHRVSDFGRVGSGHGSLCQTRC